MHSKYKNTKKKKNNKQQFWLDIVVPLLTLKQGLAGSRNVLINKCGVNYSTNVLSLLTLMLKGTLPENTIKKKVF